MTKRNEKCHILIEGVWVQFQFLDAGQLLTQQQANSGVGGFETYSSEYRYGKSCRKTNLYDYSDDSFKDRVIESNQIVVFDVG